MSRLWLIAYDIADDKRRRRLAKYLENHTDRVQESVFEGWLSPEEVRQLSTKVSSMIELKEDTVRLYPISGDAQRRRQTQGTMPTTEPTAGFWWC